MPINIKSYSIKSLIDPTTWTTGNGSATGFSVNGTANENHRFMDTDPFGIQSLIWEARPDATSGADGGWNGGRFSIDNTKLYRFSVWVNRTVQGNGNFYFGLYGYNSSNTNVGVYNRSNGSNNTNPYFWATATPTTVGEWTLVVGHAWPVGSGTGANHVDSGRYTIDGGRIGGVSLDFVWRSDNTQSMLRTYLYYSTDVSTRQRWVYPRVDLVDGTEPSIDELLLNPPGTAEISAADVREMNYDSVVQNGLVLQLDAGIFNTVTGTTWYDLSGNSNSGTLTNGPTFNSGNGGSIVFDGSNDKVGLSNNLMSELGVSSGVDNDVPYTIECVFRIHSVPSGAGTSGYSLIGHASSGGIGLQVFNSGGSAYINFGYRSNNNYTFTQQAVQLNTWYHVVCTRPAGGSAVTISCYINGSLIGTATTDLRVDYTTAQLQVGVSDTRIGYLDGDIAIGFVYNRALSSTEITQNYNVLKGRYGL